MLCTLAMSPRPDRACFDPYPSAGVDAPEPGVALPEALSKLSLSFTSRASARLLRKSERLTSPMVWALNRSSAVAFWDVNREDTPGFGVAPLEVPVDGGFEDSMEVDVGVHRAQNIKEFGQGSAVGDRLET